MKKETYIKMTQPFRDNPQMAKGIHIANRLCTTVMYVAYPLLLVYLFLQKDMHLLRAVFVPAISFVLLSVVRGKINRPRPYETFSMPPIIKKDTKGHSFPSRHVFSAAMISMTFLLVSPWMWIGVLFLCITAALAVVRVVSGVHYISDVIAGFVTAVITAVVGYIII